MDCIFEMFCDIMYKVTSVYNELGYHELSLETNTFFMLRSLSFPIIRYTTNSGYIEHILNVPVASL